MERSEEVTAILELSKDTRGLEFRAEEGATDEELAAIFGVPIEALRQYAIVLAKARANLKLRVRRAFLTAADKGNPDALAFLAKTYLEKNST